MGITDSFLQEYITYVLLFIFSYYYHTNQDKQTTSVIEIIWWYCLLRTIFSKRNGSGSTKKKRGQRAHQSVSKAPWFFTTHLFPVYIHLPPSLPPSEISHTHAYSYLHTYARTHELPLHTHFYAYT